MQTEMVVIANEIFNFINISSIDQNIAIGMIKLTIMKNFKLIYVLYTNQSTNGLKHFQCISKINIHRRSNQKSIEDILLIFYIILDVLWLHELITNKVFRRLVKARRVCNRIQNAVTCSVAPYDTYWSFGSHLTTYIQRCLDTGTKLYGLSTWNYNKPYQRYQKQKWNKFAKERFINSGSTSPNWSSFA